jgi:hypothetical protein
MFTRSILIPSMVACAIAAPIMFSHLRKPADSLTTGPESGFHQSGYGNPAASETFLPHAQPFGSPHSTFRNAAAVTSQNAPMGNPIFGANRSVILQPNPAAIQTSSPASSGGTFSGQRQPVIPRNLTPIQPSAVAEPDWASMTPDFGAAQTIVLPGDADGPDYTAQPLEFMPVMNLEEIFRFDVNPGWVKSRWKRVSTSPGDTGLHGLRVALVTGTNSWDLHGSLTYYFDGNQRVERITFRGWTGNETRLTNLLQQKYGFESQSTQWAGFYLAKKRRALTGGLLMKHPAVIYAENTVQQMALVLEVNNPQGKFTLSNDFRSLIDGSRMTQ